MSKIHILESTRPGVYKAVLHSATPAGNNQAGVAFSAALVASGRAVTILPEGTGAGQITTVEKAEVTAGITLETVTELRVESGGGSGAPLTAALNAMADIKITEHRSRLQSILRHFGRVVA